MAKQNQQQQQRTEERGQETAVRSQDADPELSGESPPASIGLDDSGSDEPGKDEPGKSEIRNPKSEIPPVATRRVDSGTPYCARHNVLMITASSQERAAYYRCPVPGCDQTDKRARPTTRIPKEPMRCPQRSCLASGGHASGGRAAEPEYLEVDAKRSTAFQLRMICPRCGFEVKVPRPGVEAAVERARREAAEDLSAR